MIVNGYNEMKPFLPNVEMKGSPSIFMDALTVAQDDLVDMILGATLEERVEARNDVDGKLLKRCQRVIATDAFLRSIPEMDLVLTDAGFGVVSNQSFVPASKDRIQNLTRSLQAKVDDSRDRLVTLLMAEYDDWRATVEFGRLSDGLFLTFADFRDAAVLNARTQPWFPANWSDFYRMNGTLNVTLMTTVASYISREYAEEILEKIRDKETFLPMETKVLKLVKAAAAAGAMNDSETAVNQAIKAARLMQDNPDDFPTFIASKASNDLTKQYTDTPIFSLL